MADPERSLVRAASGNIKPSPELRVVLEEVEKCKEFFNANKYIDYLDAVNEHYLGNRGIIIGPMPEVVVPVGELDPDDQSDLLDIGENSWGGIDCYLQYEGEEEGLIIKKRITLSFKYSLPGKAYQLSLSAFTGVVLGKETPVTKGRSTRKIFYLNPSSGLKQGVDDLLLVFTSELLEAKFL